MGKTLKHSAASRRPRRTSLSAVTGVATGNGTAAVAAQPYEQVVLIRAVQDAS